MKKEYLDRTHRFFERYGGKTIILARFVPIVRTFAPFVAGIGAMNYARFIVYNVIGGVAWVVLLTLAGYFFAGIKQVRDHFSLVIMAIVIISVMPMVIEYCRARWGKGAEQRPDSGRQPVEGLSEGLGPSRARGAGNSETAANRPAGES